MKGRRTQVVMVYTLWDDTVEGVHPITTLIPAISGRVGDGIAEVTGQHEGLSVESNIVVAIQDTADRVVNVVQTEAEDLVEWLAAEMVQRNPGDLVAMLEDGTSIVQPCDVKEVVRAVVDMLSLSPASYPDAPTPEPPPDPEGVHDGWTGQ